MSRQERSAFKFKNPGPYLGIVKNHLDPGYMGGLEVSLIKGYTDNAGGAAPEVFKVQYLSPFYGSTSVELEGNNDYKGSQKSYGMWMVPPDLGTTVMVVFLEGDPNQGYWIGCVQDRYQNHMVPGIAASDAIAYANQTQRSLYKDYKYLPVTEYNKTIAGKSSTQSPLDVSKIPKPVFEPFARMLLNQGLLADTTRGVTSSSARREIPSMVFGISTPGPADPSAIDKVGKLKYDGKSIPNVPRSRLGGTTFVMDDGDPDGNNELVRIRTRTGHQILLHNTADLIYIANAKGTAWIEMTSQGKIDIYAQDSVSIHTEADFNFKAGRAFNVDAESINMHAFGNINIDSKSNISMFAKGTSTFTGETEAYLNTKGDLHIRANGDLLLTGFNEVHTRSGKRLYVTAGDKIDILANGDTKIGGAGPVKLNERGDPSTAASYAPAGTFDINSAAATSGNSSPTNKYGAGNHATILQRVPMHEPWDQHESNNPELYTADRTDITPGALTTGAGLGPNKNVAWTPATFSNAIQFTGGGGEASFTKTTSALQTAVKNIAAQYKQKTGRDLVITSSKREYAEQKALYDAWKNGAPGIYMPANPDAPDWKKTSGHYRGIAIDTPTARDSRFQELMEQNGLYRPFPAKDPVHVQLINAPNKSQTE